MASMPLLVLPFAAMAMTFNNPPSTAVVTVLSQWTKFFPGVRLHKEKAYGIFLVIPRCPSGACNLSHETLNRVVTEGETVCQAIMSF